MKQKQKIKILIDSFMLVLLPCLMVFQITGQEVHEWIGTMMFVLFLIHNGLNISWYSHLMKGQYKAVRILQLCINMLLLLIMLSLGFSGIVLSRHVFGFLDGPMATARVMHLVSSYWGFILMCIHAGMHCGVMKSVFKNRINLRTLRPLAAVFGVYGIFCFFKLDLSSYMFLQKHFVFFDFERHPVFVSLDYISMMILFISIGFLLSEAVKRIQKKKRQ